MRNILSVILALVLASTSLEAQTILTVTNQLVVPITNFDAAACTGTGHDDGPAFKSLISSIILNWRAQARPTHRAPSSCPRMVSSIRH